MGHQQVEPVVAVQSFRIDPHIAKRSLEHRLIRGERIEGEPVAIQLAERDARDGRITADQRQSRAHQRHGFIDQAQMIPADAIPLQHREFWVVAAAGLAVAEHTAEFVAVADAGREQALERKFRRGAQPARTRRALGATAEFQRERCDVRIGIARYREHRRFDFQHVTIREEHADRRVEPRAQAQRVGIRGGSPVGHDAPCSHTP